MCGRDGERNHFQTPVHAGKVEGVELHVDAHSQSKVGETHPGRRTHILRVSHRWVGSHRASSCEEVQTSLLQRFAGEVKKQVRGCGFDPLIECALTTTRKGETTTCGTQHLYICSLREGKCAQREQLVSQQRGFIPWKQCRACHARHDHCHVSQREVLPLPPPPAQIKQPE